MARATFKDRDGSVVAPGDRVRVLAVPNLAGMRSPYREATAAVFGHIKGSVKRVHSVDAHGNAVLAFRIRRGAHADYHFVSIEGKHVRRAQAAVGA